MQSIFEASGGTYSKVGDYYLPNLLPPEQTELARYGLFGRMRSNYLKSRHMVLYKSILMDGTLNHHLNETDRRANESLDHLVRDMAAAQGITEQLKANDQMAWVGAMNNIRSAVMEIVLTEIIYVSF
jgi:hypothetical protein